MGSSVAPNRQIGPVPGKGNPASGTRGTPSRKGPPSRKGVRPTGTAERRDWHSLDTVQVVQQQRSDAGSGLSKPEVSKRLEKFGPNQLPERPPTPAWRAFLEQFSDFMILVLLGAAALSMFLGEVADAVAIAAIVFLNAVLGFVQEARAERSLAALKCLTAPKARVRRDGKTVEVEASAIVPGD